MRVFLETERMWLREFTADDLDLLVELDSDPAVMRFITGGRATPRDEIRDDILPAWLGYYERFAGYGFWAAIDKASGDFLGWFHFRPAPGRPLDEPELGYRLRRAAWGNGYATEGSRALIAKGFADHGVRRVVAETMAVNTASRRVMEKAGMTLVRTFFQEWPDRIEGDEFGDVEYAIERAEREPSPGAMKAGGRGALRPPCRDLPGDREATWAGRSSEHTATWRRDHTLPPGGMTKQEDEGQRRAPARLWGVPQRLDARSVGAP
ncbi:MAG TPA: GNAT family N-acetyltransferase [Thermomicrobiales bacterium]|nr:GNAT family N-acetyltransferase [Thermomicrobiales bacterium]